MSEKLEKQNILFSSNKKIEKVRIEALDEDEINFVIHKAKATIDQICTSLYMQCDSEFDVKFFFIKTNVKQNVFVECNYNRNGCK